MTNYQLRITLKGIEPPIWRSLVVPATTTLTKLHRIIQIAFGWEDYHLYLFTIERVVYGEGVLEWAEYDQKVLNAKRTILEHVVSRQGARFLYEYDIGDGWKHEVYVEGIREDATGKLRCLDGARSGPPEDCGGPHGYMDMLETIFNPNHPQFHEMREWLGDGFEPERFNPEVVNRRLGRLKV